MSELNADRLDIHVIWFPLHVQLHLHSVILLSFDLEKTCSTYASEMKKLKPKPEVPDNDYNTSVKHLPSKSLFSSVIAFDYSVEKILTSVHI